MPFVVKKIIVILIVILSLSVLAGGAFIGFGFYIYDKDEVLPNISIDGIDISGISRDEVIKRLRVTEYEQRNSNASVTVKLPDNSELTITGEEAGIRSNIREIIDIAYNFGRGYGFFRDTINYLNRYTGENINFESTEVIDTDFIYSSVEEFVNRFNTDFAALKPHINHDSIDITIGAGFTYAVADDVYDMVLSGLMMSLDEGAVNVVYMPPEVPEFRMAAELEMLWQDTHVLSVSAVYDKETREITESVVGVTFDFTHAMDILRSAEIRETVTIELIKTEPDVSKEYLESFLFVDIIGEQTTSVGGTEDRLHNVALAASKIHGTVLEPGEEFSFNRIVGPRTLSRGFRVAPVIVNKKMVPGIGGGICQVSSTLYSAIKDTGLRVTARSPHGIPISYLPHGRDATVVYGAIDFRFVNNTDRPIRLDFFLEGRRLTARVEGTLPEGWVPTLR